MPWKVPFVEGSAVDDDVNNKYVPPDELAQLLNETNFTQREIEGFYKYATDGGTISKAEFGCLCFDRGIKTVGLVDRMWTLFDDDSDGQLTHYELVKALNPLLRGGRRQIAEMFFDLYEIDGDGEVSAAEIISVYSDMICLTDGYHKDGLTSSEKENIRTWVEEQRGNSQGARLDKETFVNAVLNMETDDTKPPLLSWRTSYYVFLTAWFEVGTSFALPAMGALSDRIKDRFDIEDSGIGTATSAYFFAAMVGPLMGGLFMDKYGPGPVLIGANLIVTIGASLQAIANGPDQFWLLIVGRLFLGFGGEITPFTTVETLSRLFPEYVGLMAGIRNLIQSGSTFLAFVLLPAWANAFGEGNSGTSFALWMCAVLGLVSMVASTITYLSIRKEQNISAEAQSDQATVSKVMRTFARATAPQAVGLQRWQLPLSFYLATYGIKAQYFAPFGFTAFSNSIYADKFGQNSAQSSLLSGLISLIAGLMSPFMGQLSDNWGRRSSCLAIASALSMIGFFVLAVSAGGSASVWVATLLFALQYGFGDTVAYLSIRFIVGVSRAGVGYGVYGILGNLIATVVPIIGGVLMDQPDNGNDKVLWYFFGLMGIGVLCWVGVLLLEGHRSLLELPAEKVIETTDEDLQLAALCFVVGENPSKHQSCREESSKTDPQVEQAVEQPESEHSEPSEPREEDTV